MADFSAGSGSALKAAELVCRGWIVFDLSRYSTHVTRKRRLEIPGCKPFEVLNRGKYERKYWQVATFGDDLDDDGAISVYEYVAFILKLHGASPVAGMQHLHGKKGEGFVQLVASTSRVPFDEFAGLFKECWALKVRGQHSPGGNGEWGSIAR